MRLRILVLFTSATLLACACLAQNTTTASAAPPVTGSAPAVETAASPERAQINQLFESYESAYNHKDLAALLAIYPSLQNEKDFKKVKWHLSEDPNVFSEKVTLSPADVQINGDKATVHGKRNEVYVSLETRSEITQGDANMENMPVQDPSPIPQTKKKVSNKTDDVVMELQKTPTGWQIASLTAEKSKKH
jgi:hypothetical protein